jgi:site-specific DNA-methyltransferase (adenine-specific)
MIRFDKKIQGTRDSDNYATPKRFYNQINSEYNFTFDPCPYKHDLNAWNGLEVDWNGNVYINPPYSSIEPFIGKGIEEIKKGNANKCVYLIPVRSDTKYWHNLIMKYASKIIFIQGRLNFNESKAPAPFPCVLVVFDSTRKESIIAETLVQI